MAAVAGKGRVATKEELRAGGHGGAAQEVAEEELRAKATTGEHWPPPLRVPLAGGTVPTLSSGTAQQLIRDRIAACLLPFFSTAT